MLQICSSDLKSIGESFLSWLRNTLSAAQRIELPPLQATEGGGSSQTLFLNPLITQEGVRRQEKWVLRIQATDHQVYQDPAVERQYLVMKHLAQLGSAPVPQVLWYESDPGVLGAPFFVMEQVQGEVPDAFYHNKGLFTEASASEREQMWLSAMQALVSIHNTDIEPFDFLAHPELGNSGLDQEIAVWDAYRDWHGVPLTGVQEKTRLWLEENLPDDRPTGLAWGDARLPNMIFRDNRCEAVIDWETASLAGAETDLAWWLFFDWYMTEGSGIPPLSGLPGAEMFITTWEELSGRKARNIHWHEIFATWRYSMIRDRALMLFGQEIPDDFETTDPALLRLAAMISE